MSMSSFPTERKGATINFTRMYVKILQFDVHSLLLLVLTSFSQTEYERSGNVSACSLLNIF